MVRRFALSFVITVLFSVNAFAQKSLPDSLRSTFNADTVKITWSRSLMGDYGFPSHDAVFTQDQVLMGFSTARGHEDTLISTVGNFQKPLICRNGKTIVYTDLVQKQMFAVDWNDTVSTPRGLGWGCSGALWYNAASGKEYVIYSDNRRGVAGSGLYGNYRVRRRNISDTTDDSIIYNSDLSQTLSTAWLCISSDAKVLGDVWIWGQTVYDVTIANNTPLISAVGCWSSMPYDTTYRFVVDADLHDGWNVYDPSVSFMSPAWKVKPGTYVTMPRMATYSTNVLLYQESQAAGGSGGGYLHAVLTSDSINRPLVNISITKYNDGFPDLWRSPTPCSACIPGAIKPAAIGREREAQSVTFQSLRNKAMFTLDGRRITYSQAQRMGGLVFVKRGERDYVKFLLPGNQ